jgi:hypothetical protein
LPTLGKACFPHDRCASSSQSRSLPLTSSSIIRGARIMGGRLSIAAGGIAEMANSHR